MEVTMFDLSNPQSWELITNLALVLVALITFVYLGAGAFRKAVSRSAVRVTDALRRDPHTLVLHDLGITMADGGEKIQDAPHSAKSDPHAGNGK
jgi:hypothetical protein